MTSSNPLAALRYRVQRELGGQLLREAPCKITRADGRSYRWTGYRIVRPGAAPVSLSTEQARRAGLARQADLAALIERLQQEAL